MVFSLLHFFHQLLKALALSSMPFLFFPLDFFVLTLLFSPLFELSLPFMVFKPLA